MRFYPHPDNKDDDIPTVKYDRDRNELPRMHPVPGALVTDGVTYGKGEDLFLTSQVVNIGTARPTHYVIPQKYSPKLEWWNLKDIAQAVSIQNHPRMLD